MNGSHTIGATMTRSSTIFAAADAPARSEPGTTHAGPGDEDKGFQLARSSGCVIDVLAGCVGPSRKDTS